jgi:hypothetical protein
VTLSELLNLTDDNNFDSTLQRDYLKLFRLLFGDSPATYCPTRLFFYRVSGINADNKSGLVKALGHDAVNADKEPVH